MALGCSPHDLQNGHYQLKVDQLIADNCRIVPTDGGLWDGHMDATAEIIHFTLAPDSILFLGQYDAQPWFQNDVFNLDGQITSALIQGRDDGGAGHLCVSNLVQGQMRDVEVDNSTSFNGRLQLTYTLAPVQSDTSFCVGFNGACTLNATFSANRIP
jgi:hypothetical protein